MARCEDWPCCGHEDYCPAPRPTRSSSGFKFNDHREIRARFASVGSCGHRISTGDVIGWAKSGRTSHTCCTLCWNKWKSENAEAAMMEAMSNG